MTEKIFTTRPYLPPLEEFTEIFSKAWNRHWLTNDGVLHKEFEQKLCKYLNVGYISLFNNATIALLIAQRVQEFSGDIITTPFSFIATAHSIKWNGYNPVFADTDSKTGNLSPENVEKAITDKTGGILAVHNYGIPGDIEGMQAVSDKYSLPLIYDAAPAMGVKYKGESILKYGDLAVLSFHATKVFTTIEGGAIISRSAEIKKRIDRLKNFAILNEETVAGLGINGKMNEAEAAMGICQLKYISQMISKRKEIFNIYSEEIRKFSSIRIMEIPENVDYNYSYFPIFFKNGFDEREYIYKKMKENNIFCRKYWYPLITKHNIYKSSIAINLTNATKISESVLCLPIYPDLDHLDVKRIIKIIRGLRK